MNNKLVLALVAILVIIAIGGYAYPKVQTQIVEKVVDNFGATPSPDIQSEYLNINGVRFEYRSQIFSTSSTTRCALRSPVDRSSVLISGVVKSATTTDYTLAVAKSTTAFATTTQIRTETVTSNSEVVFPTASSTQTALTDTNRTFAAGEWLVVSTAGPTATAFDSGSCSAMFLVGF
jgi:hypothetical protein